MYSVDLFYSMQWKLSGISFNDSVRGANVFICILKNGCYWLPEEGYSRSFLLTKGKLGRPETICMLSAGVLHVSLFAAQNSVAIILLMVLIWTIKYQFTIDRQKNKPPKSELCCQCPHDKVTAEKGHETSTLQNYPYLPTAKLLYHITFVVGTQCPQLPWNCSFLLKTVFHAVTAIKWNNLQIMEVRTDYLYEANE